jgi:hypothetical protein
MGCSRGPDRPTIHFFFFIERLLFGNGLGPGVVAPAPPLAIFPPLFQIPLDHGFQLLLLFRRQDGVDLLLELLPDLGEALVRFRPELLDLRRSACDRRSP